jgi:hypothetical protein
MSGSYQGKTKLCGCFDFRDGNSKYVEMPELLYGRYNHSMITFNQKYLYIFGG